MLFNLQCTVYPIVIMPLQFKRIKKLSQNQTLFKLVLMYTYRGLFYTKNLCEKNKFFMALVEDTPLIIGHQNRPTIPYIACPLYFHLMCFITILSFISSFLLIYTCYVG